MPVEELDLDAQHLVEAPASLIDIAAGTAIQLAAGGLLGDTDGRVDRRHRVLLRDDEQDIGRISLTRKSRLHALSQQRMFSAPLTNLANFFRA